MLEVGSSFHLFGTYHMPGTVLGNGDALSHWLYDDISQEQGNEIGILACFRKERK